MIKTFKKLQILLFVSGLFFSSSAFAYDIPKEYNLDFENPTDNIQNIINYLVVEARGSQEAQAVTDKEMALKHTKATALYGEALAMRTNMIKDSLEVKPDFESPDRRMIKANEIQPVLVSINKRFNEIISMESALADLEGTMLITSIPIIAKPEKEEEPQPTQGEQ